MFDEFPVFKGPFRDSKNCPIKQTIRYVWSLLYNIISTIYNEGAEEHGAVGEGEEEEEEEECEFEPHEQLHMLTQYLRMWYMYCLWCGTKFEDGDDLGANCPGDTRELHDE